MRKLILSLALFLFLILLIDLTASEAAIIDFENFNIGSPLPYPPALNVGQTINFNNVSGTGVDVEITGFSDLYVWDIQAWASPGIYTYGQGLAGRTVGAPAATSTEITIDFSSPVFNFSLLAGDSSNDDDGALRIDAYDYDNNLIESAEANWGWGVSIRDSAQEVRNFEVLSALGLPVGISRVVYQSFGDTPNSTFIDNITFTPIPEPVTTLLFGIGLLGLSGVNRRKK